MGKKRRSGQKEYISEADIIQMAQQNVRNIQKRARVSSSDIFTRGMRQMRQLDYQPKVKVYGGGITFEAYRRSREIIKQIERAKTEQEMKKHMGEFFRTVGGWKNLVDVFGGRWRYYHWHASRSQLMTNITKMMFGRPYASFYYAEPPRKGNLPHWQKQRAISFYLNEKGNIQRLVATGKPEERAKFVAKALKQIPIKIKTVPGSQGYMQWRNPKTGMWEKIDIATRTVVAKSPTKFAGVELWKGKR